MYYNNQNNTFKANLKLNHKIEFLFSFNIHNKLYVFNAIENMKSIKTISTLRLNVEDHSKLHNFNKQDIINIQIIRKIHLAFSHPNDTAMLKIIKSESFSDLKLSYRDLSNYNTYFSFCDGCLKGKATNQNEINSNIEPTKCFEHVSMDLFIINSKSKEWNVIFIDELTNWGYVETITKRDTESIWKTFNNFLAKVNSFNRNYRIKKLFSDNEKSIMACEKRFNKLGIQLITCAPNGHINTIERYIRTIENKVLSTIYQLKYNLPACLVKYCIQFVVDSMNYTPNSKSVDSTPIKIVSGEDFISPSNRFHEFGSFVLLKTPYLKSKHDSKSEIGILLNKNYSIMNKVLVFIPLKNTVVYRRFLKYIPLNKNNVKNLNIVLNGFTDMDNKKCIVNEFLWDTQNDMLVYEHDLISKYIISNNNENLLKVADRNKNNYHVLDQDNETDYYNLSGDEEFETFSSDEEHEDSIKHRENIEVSKINHHENEINHINAIKNYDEIQYDEDLLNQGNNNYDYSSDSTYDSEYENENSINNFNKENVSDDDVWEVEHINYKERMNTQVGRPYYYNVKFYGFDEPEMVSRAQLINFSNSDLANVLSKEEYLAKNHDDVQDISNNNMNDNNMNQLLNEKENDESMENVQDITTLNVTFTQSMKQNESLTVSAIINEFNSLRDMDVYDFMDEKFITNDIKSKIIPGFPILKQKVDTDNKPTKFKARFCCNGKVQKNKNNELWTYAPTISNSVVKLVLGISCFEKRMISIIDIQVAFLNSILEEPVYVKVPAYIVNILVKNDQKYYGKHILKDGSLLLKLKRSLYGLSNSPYNWNKTLSDALTEFGFTRSITEPCLFVKFYGSNSKFILTCFVDDLLCSYEHEDQIIEFKTFLIKKFKNITINSNSTNFDYLGIGIEYQREKGYMLMHQKGYINQLLQKFNVKGYSKVPFSSDLFEQGDINDLSLQKSIGFECKPGDSKLFLSILMSISFILATKPELAVGVSVLSMRSKSPTLKDFKALEKILKYINLTKHLVLKLRPNSLSLFAYVDSAYLVHSDSKSQSGICISLGEIGDNFGCLIYSKSKKTSMVCKSSCESELVAIDASLNELIFLQKCCKELSIDNGKIFIYNDNLSTKKICENESINFKAAKHINMRFYFIRDKIKEGVVELKYKNTNLLVSDVLTKALSNPKFSLFTSLLLCKSNDVEMYQIDN
jgi:hypothetical protein